MSDAINYLQFCILLHLINTEESETDAGQNTSANSNTVTVTKSGVIDVDLYE